MPRILYLTYNSVLTSGILQSQVSTLLLKLRTKYPEALHFTLITSEQWTLFRDKQKTTELCNELTRAGIRVCIIPKFLPKQLSSTIKINWFKGILDRLLLIIDLLILTLVSIFLIFRDKITIIHTRSYIPGLIGRFLKTLTGCKHVFDPRGLIPEELQLTHQWDSQSRPYLKWKRLEIKILKSADQVIVLSKPFCQHYQNIFSKLNPIIIPCVTDTSVFDYSFENRKKQKAQLELTSKFVVLYVMGHYVPYQDFDRALKVFQAITHFLPQAHFLILTPDHDSVKDDFKQTTLSASSYSIYSPSFKEMPNYLQAADLGLQVRVPSVITRVSSPVKFAEYLACGIPVLCQKGIGDTEDIILHNHVGMIFLSPELSSLEQKWILRLTDPAERTAISQRCRNTALNQLSWDSYLHQFYTLYNSLV